jgi:hypothetical protein
VPEMALVKSPSCCIPENTKNGDVMWKDEEVVEADAIRVRDQELPYPTLPCSTLLYSTLLYSALPFSALSHNQPKFFSLLLSTSTVSLRFITSALVQVVSDSIHELALVFILQLYCIF